MAHERKTSPIESFPSPLEVYCNTDWACVKLAEKIGKEGSPRNLNHIFKKAISNNEIKHLYPSRGILLLLREDVLKFIDSYNMNEIKAKSNGHQKTIDYDKIEEIFRRVIKEEFYK